MKVCSIILSSVEPNDVKICKTQKPGEPAYFQLRLGDDFCFFTTNSALPEYEAIGHAIARKAREFESQDPRGDWDWRMFRLDAIKTLAAAYEEEHDFDADEDPQATYELLDDVRSIHAELVAALGDPPPAPEPIPADPEIPF